MHISHIYFWDFFEEEQMTERDSNMGDRLMSKCGATEANASGITFGIFIGIKYFFH